MGYYGGGVSDPVPISRSLDSIMKSLRGTDRIQIGGVFGRWDDAVGPAVAAHVRPVRLDQGVLTVEADEPAWATQVKFLAGTITARLAEVANVEIERIDVRVGPRRCTARSSTGSTVRPGVLPDSVTPRW